MAFLASFSASVWSVEYRRYAAPPPTHPAADVNPIGREDLGVETVPFDDLAANLNPDYEGPEGGQRHRAARYLLASPLERLIQFGAVDAVQPDQLISDDDGVDVDDLGGTRERIAAPAERLNVKMATRRPSIRLP